MALHCLDSFFLVLWLIQTIGGTIVGREESSEPVSWVSLEQGPIVGIDPCQLSYVIDISQEFN